MTATGPHTVASPWLQPWGGTVALWAREATITVDGEPEVVDVALVDRHGWAVYDAESGAELASGPATGEAGQDAADAAAALLGMVLL